MSRYSIVLLNDWRRVRNRHSGMTLFNLSGDWLAGEWITGEVTAFGLGLTVTRWSRRPVRLSGFDKIRADLEAACLDSPSDRGLSGWVNAQPIKPGESFQFYEDPWPEGVPVESLGREHAP